VGKRLGHRRNGGWGPGARLRGAPAGAPDGEPAAPDAGGATPATGADGAGALATGVGAAEIREIGPEPGAWHKRIRGVSNDRAGDTDAPSRSSDEDLVRALYAEHAAALLRYVWRMTDGDRQRAEDIVQETLLRAWLHPEAIAHRPARPWLFAVARNLAVDAHRAKKARPHEVGEGALSVVPVPDEADRVLESWAVADALAALRPDHRRVLLETYYHGRSVSEAAAVLGIPAGTVKSRAFYALRALKLELEERGLAP
jgi:RNA polymerase sigma-70 factor (ECF subfamily)